MSDINTWVELSGEGGLGIQFHLTLPFVMIKSISVLCAALVERTIACSTTYTTIESLLTTLQPDFFHYS